MMGANNDFSEIPPVATQNLWAQDYYGILSFPPNMVKWISIRSNNFLETKGIKCRYSKVLRIRVTHTMIPGLITSWRKIHLCYRTKMKLMDVVADKVEVMKGRKYGPSKAILNSIWFSVLHV
jgi:hypothetical protein